MTKEEFREAFASALEQAVKVAEDTLGFAISRNLAIVLHDPNYRGQIADAESAADSLYLGENRFYVVIDMAVQEVSRDSTQVFVRVSGHEPVEYVKTWHDSSGNRMFKQLIAQIRVAPDLSRNAH